MSKPIRTINRSVVIIRPKQPFLDWLSSEDNESGRNPFSTIRTDKSNAFLIPEHHITDSTEAQLYIEKCWEEVFEQFLFEWIVEDSLWPQNRTLQMFREWFEMIYAPIIWDVVDEPLEIEELDEDEPVLPSHLH